MLSFAERHRAPPLYVMPRMRGRSKGTAPHACMLSGFGRVRLLETLFLLSSTVNQRHIFMYAPPVGPPSHSGHRSEPSRVPCATQEVLPSCLFYPWMATVRMRQSQAPSSSRSLFSLGICYPRISFGGRPAPAALKGNGFWEKKLQLS